MNNYNFKPAQILNVIGFCCSVLVLKLKFILEGALFMFGSMFSLFLSISEF
jgi:hypothetical protein